MNGRNFNGYQPKSSGKLTTPPMTKGYGSTVTIPLYEYRNLIKESYCKNNEIETLKKEYAELIKQNEELIKQNNTYMKIVLLKNSKFKEKLSEAINLLIEDIKTVNDNEGSEGNGKKLKTNERTVK